MTPLVWLVTGCSSGFGEQFVHAILARGDKVIASGRNAAERLSHLKSTANGAAILDLDVTIPRPELDSKIEEALKIYGVIDVLVNNAGYIESGALEELGHDRFVRCLNTNLFGPVNLSQAILPHFRQRNAGVLVFVGSQAGWKGDPGATAYCASKFALAGVVDCLAQELAMFSPELKAILFEPGYFRTQALSQTNIKHGTPSIPEYAAFNEISLQYEKSVYGKEPGDPRKAVEMMIDVVKAEGSATGKVTPLRLPLGSDGLKVVRDKCEAMLTVCKDWEPTIISTDISIGRSVPRR